MELRKAAGVAAYRPEIGPVPIWNETLPETLMSQLPTVKWPGFRVAASSGSGTGATELFGCFTPGKALACSSACPAAAGTAAMAMEAKSTSEHRMDDMAATIEPIGAQSKACCDPIRISSAGAMSVIPACIFSRGDIEQKKNGSFVDSAGISWNAGARMPVFSYGDEKAVITSVEKYHGG